MAAPEILAKPARRVFLDSRELPGLVVGTALGDPAACRRVLGARRGGRFGVLLALGALALAAPSARLALAATAFYVALTFGLGAVARRTTGHTTREVLRLSVWAVLTPLCVAALARAFAATAWPLWLAVLAGQALLWRALAATR